MKSQSGFTLIEMVAVIIILAIMAATALPKFTNLSGEARYASLSGLQGGLRSAMMLAKSKWLVTQSGNLNTIDFNGTKVSVVNFQTAGSATANLGIPLDNAAGIIAAMDSWGTYESGTDADGYLSWYPNGVTTSSSCYVRYESATAEVKIKPDTLTTANAATQCI